MGNTSIGLLSEDQKLAELPLAAFEALVAQKRIDLTPGDLKKASESRILERLFRASESDLRIANHRCGFIDRYVHDGSLPATTDVPLRTFYRWVAQYRQAEMSSSSYYQLMLP